MEFLGFDFLVITVLFFVVAVVYSSVGHAGASGYSAVMALLSIQPSVMKSTSLMLNIAVGLIGFYRFYRAGLVDLKKMWPFILFSMPIAFFSSQLTIDKKIFFLTLGILLLISGVKLFLSKASSGEAEQKETIVAKPIAMFSGAAIGFLSGITGTGGAIFFTPLLIGTGWAKPREAAGLSVCFVLANSAFALAGVSRAGSFVDVKFSLVWIVVVVVGALVGTHLGIFKFSGVAIKKVLGLVLITAAVKLLMLSFQ